VKRSQTVFETRSEISGRIRVIDFGTERRLMVAGEILSILPRDGDWSRVHREYWAQAVATVDLPPRPSVLLVGLGGGTQVHLLHQRARPRRVTVIERDEAIVDVAREWFGLDALGPLEVCCGDAFQLVPGLARLGRRFDFIMEDAAYGDGVAGAVELAQALAPLVAPRGTLVLNRHRRHDARDVATAMEAVFRDVRMRRVKREGENVLIFCSRVVKRLRSPR
jgi:spermidine synthase